ncbi:hypothetical protein L3X38_030860 [Prunus dulcis]|uniref:Uncharacterized protein n=1 Tax=Prunus dulcis TaxID=3755 RepID=A0AAD4YUF3_PRUDU|nr:hypothetical protein L3X38_030860 [Prunus dulcis]
MNPAFPHLDLQLGGDEQEESEGCDEVAADSISEAVVWGQIGVETPQSLTVHVLKVQVEGLNYLDWEQNTVALVRIRAGLGVGGEDDGDGASDGVIVAIPQRKLLEQAAVALRVFDEGSGCIDQLYKSVQDLDEEYLKSNYHKEILLAPKLYPGFGYENHLLGIEDGQEASYYYARYLRHTVQEILTNDKTLIPSNYRVPLKLKYCKSQGDYKSDAGFLSRPAMFTITDSLMIRPISPLFGVSVLNELKVPFADIEMQTVQVGKEECNVGVPARSEVLDGLGVVERLAVLVGGLEVLVEALELLDLVLNGFDVAEELVEVDAADDISIT